MTSEPPVEALFLDRHKIDSVTFGTWLAVLSAFCYTASVMALRQLAHRDDIDWAIWIACLKAVPLCTVSGAAVVHLVLRRRQPWPPRKFVVELLLAGLFVQFAGNVCFQLALSLSGMSLSVPLAHATMILSAAVLGHAILGEHLTSKTIMAVTVLIMSVVVLSFGTNNGDTRFSAGTSPLAFMAGPTAACITGFGYGLMGVVVRRVVTRDVAIPVTVFLLSLTGVFGLGLTTLARKGPLWMLQTSTSDLWMVTVAGIFNAIAFIALSAALKTIPVVRANLVNASQTALAAMAGVAFFNETLTAWLIFGCLLTGTGLLLMERSRK